MIWAGHARLPFRPARPHPGPGDPHLPPPDIPLEVGTARRALHSELVAGIEFLGPAPRPGWQYPVDWHDG